MAQIKEKVPLARASHSCRERNSSVKNYQLWQQNNKPIEKWSKLDYVHQNLGNESIAVQEIIVMILKKF
ncbi:TPA: hypothetical protein ACWX1I_001413 [Elizabethkingia anophelis]